MTIVTAKPPRKRPQSTGPRPAALVNGSCIVTIPRKTKQQRANERWDRAAAKVIPEAQTAATAWLEKQFERT